MPASFTSGNSQTRLSIVNAERRTLPGPRLLHELVASPSEESIALEFLQQDGQSIKLSYCDFHRLADILSHDIGEQISTATALGQIVPVIIPQCPELYLAWLSVLKCGAAFCPISHDVPPERLKFILQDVGATFVLTTSATSDIFKDAISKVKSMVVSLENLQAKLQSSNSEGTPSQSRQAIDPSSPAYVMYTSGSTGLPKGVAVSHFSASQSLLAHDEHIPLFKRFLQFASPTFDVSIFEIFFPFFRGATLVGCDRDRMLADLPATIRALNADAAELTPTVAGTLLKTRKAAPCLELLLTIGEMLTARVVREFGGDQDQPSMLYGMYGPTEAAIHCTVAPKMAADASVRSIGRPLSTVTAFVVRQGESPEIVPLGEPGELVIAGQLAVGYLNRPEQNRAAFIDLPGYGPAYKTGDRAFVRADGELEILGRMTSGQVKLRGQRVELGEVEEVASKTEGVQLAIASVIDQLLVLFYSADYEVGVAPIRARCRSWLPPYMRPGEILFIGDQVPRLPSGKIDRKALEHDYRSKQEAQTRDNTFANTFEEEIANIICAELGTRIDRNTSFWSVGLDSLRAIQIASRLRQRCSSVNAALLTEIDNVAELADFIQTSSISTGDLAIETEDEASQEWQTIKTQLSQDLSAMRTDMPWEKILPCSNMQVAMLIETTNNPEQNFNDIWLRLAADVTIGDLRRAFEQLSDSNEILRSGFMPTGSKDMPFAQVVWPRLADTDLDILYPFHLEPSASEPENEAHVTIHHALYDGWSWDAIVDDLNAILSGRNAHVRTPFSAFRASERRFLRSGTPAMTEYWQSQLEGFKPARFPSLSVSRSTQEQRKFICLPLSVSYQQLSDSATSLHCSRETLLEAAWSMLLSSYQNDSDIIFGVVSANRHHSLPGIESIIGPCLSMIPIRVDTSALRTTHDLANHIQARRTLGLKHEANSLRDINIAAGLHAGDKLFDTLCVWQQSVEGNETAQYKVTTVQTQDALDYAIVLEFEPRDDKLYVKLTYDADRIPEMHADMLAKQLDSATTRLMSDPELPLGRLWEETSCSILSLANTDFERFNDSFDLTTTISRLAESRPEKVAVEFVHNIDVATGAVEKTALTYGKLFAYASTVASTLQSQYDVQGDDLVCLFGPKSIHLYIGILGTLLAGAAYLCIDPRTPRDRIHSILIQAKCKLVLMTNTIQELDHLPTSTSVSIANILAQSSTPTDIATRRPSTQSQLAYAVFTSGSTGVPKGVLVTRRNLLSNLDNLSRIYHSEPETDRLLQACSPAFDVSVFEIFWTWHMGMTLCTASNDVLFRDLEYFINECRITHLSMTPSVAALVRSENVPDVKVLVTAGEPMSSKVFADWADHGLYQGYGPSETTNICNVRPLVSKIDSSNNVGCPLPNTSIFICQKQIEGRKITVELAGASPGLGFKLLPKGGVGEVWIGGEQVGRGYMDPALTAKSFFDHPQYGRLYRSGDIGKLLCDDSLVILGREDDQVKLRGQRIELEEINSALVRCREVDNALTLVFNEHGETAARLISFWTPSHSDGASLPDVNAALYEQVSDLLPTYMIPDALLRLNHMPLTRQGKVDRANMIEYYRNLDPMQLEAASRGSRFSDDVADFSRDEKVIAEAVYKILGVQPETVTRSSSFYALGLDSISAIHLARALRDQYPTLEISTLLRHPSIGQLTKHLGSQITEYKKQSISDAQSHRLDHGLVARVHEAYSQMGLEVEKVLPCTPLQESMAVTAMNTFSKAYRNLLEFKIAGDMVQLRKAWNHALTRHQILRTGFFTSDSPDHPFVQVVLQNFELPWAEEDLRDTTQHIPENMMLPPWSLTLSGSPQVVRTLTLHMHHCLYDAEAMNILLSEIQQIYHKKTLPPTSSFDQYLSFMESSEVDETYQFWRRKLNGITPCILSQAIDPSSKVPSGINTLVQRETTLRASDLHQAVRKLESTPLTIFQATWSRLLFCIFQKQEACFGNVFSGRNLPIQGIENTVAPCFNTLPMRIQSHRSTSNRDLCQILQQMNTEILSYQASSLRRIQKEIDLKGAPLFDTLLLLQQDEIQLDSEIWTLVKESGDMSFPFILEIVIGAKTDSIFVKLHSEVAAESISKQLLDAFDALLSHTTKYPQARVLDYSSVTQELPRWEPTMLTSVSSNSIVSNASGHGSVHPEEELSHTEVLIKDILVHFKPEISHRVFRNTTIFHLGFDSINAVQIAAKLRKRGFNVSSGDVMEAASIDSIASLCDSRTGATNRPLLFDLDGFDRQYRPAVCQTNSIDEQKVEHVWPCTPTQSGILLEFLRSNRKLYYNHMYFKLNEDVDLIRLRHAWSVAMSVHEMLRTGFAEVDNSKCPFVMIIYHPNVMRQHWDNDDIDFRAQHGLSSPSWHLRFSTDGSSPAFQLSILHALYDAHSLQIILNDVASVYNGGRVSKTSPLAPTVSKILAVSRDESSKSFWSKMSKDMCLTLFPDMKVYLHETKPYSTKTLRGSIPYSTLEKACADAGASMQALVTAAWAILLSAYTSQNHVTFGVILSGRDLDEEDNEVAFPCINTIPFAIEVSTDEAKLLEDATKRCAGLLRYQHSPLSSIKRWAGIEGDLFDSVVVLQKYDSYQGALRPWTLIQDDATAEYAVSLEVLPREDAAVDFQLTFRDDLLPPEQAVNVLREYDAIIQSIIAPASNDHRISGSILSVVPAKQERIPSDINFLHELVESTTQERPDSIALEFVTDLKGTIATKQTWTYSQLDTNGNKIARLLQQNGAEVGEHVAICFDKCPEASFAILGILKAGCGYLAIDPGAPLKRKEFIIQDSCCDIVLTTSDKVAEFAFASNVSVLAIDNNYWQELSAQKPTLTRQLLPGDTCYCLYTSGTTGTPKGCLISHDSAVQAMLSFKRIFHGRWNESSKWLQFASFHFDVSVLEQYWSWSVGICVTSAPRDLLFEDLSGTISALKITHLDLTPSLARLLNPTDVPSLHQGVFIVGGEQVRQDILETWGDIGCLYNFYGPSEVTIGCTVHQQVPKHAKATNIGQQWDNVGSFVLEPGSQKPVLRGAVGELCLSGPLVGKGYLNRDDLSAEKFVMLPAYHTRVYRTGDLVRLLHDDSFEFLGRIDDQVKLRGQRLEIGEINHIVLTADSTIKDSATMVLKHHAQQKEHLVTFFSTAKQRLRNLQPSLLMNQESRSLTTKIRRNCTEKLPAYMVPTHFLAVSTIPLSINNKVDHKSLKALYEKASTESMEDPFDDDNRSTNGDSGHINQVADVLASFLQIPISRITPTSRLFHLGLDSISAIGLAAALRRNGFPNTGVATILRHPVVKELANAISLEDLSGRSEAVNAARESIRSFGERHLASIVASMEVNKSQLEHVAPCTPLQEGMISKIMRTGSQDTTYFSCFRFQLQPKVDIARLSKAWSAAQRSISILRTFFVSTADGYAQVVLSECPQSVKIKNCIDHSDPNMSTQQQRFGNWVKSAKSLSTSLPWTVELLTSRSNSIMNLYIFHGLYDGNSLSLLLQAVKQYYDAPDKLFPSAMQFYEALPYGPLLSSSDEKAFWSSRLRCFSSLKLRPLDANRNELRYSTFKETITNGSLQSVCNNLNVTTTAIFQASLLYALHKHFKSEPSMGVVVSGRATAQEDLGAVIGPMFNTIPYAINCLQARSTFADLIQECHKFNVDVIPYQQTPLRKIARYIDQDINKGLFDVLFVFQKSSLDGDNELWCEIPTETSPDYPVNFEIEQKGSTFTITLATSSTHLHESDARELLKTYLDIINNAATAKSPLPAELCKATIVLASNAISSNEDREPIDISVTNEQDSFNSMEMRIRSQVATLASVQEQRIRRHHPTIFELGLDSIEAMKLAARLKTIGLKITVSAIMKSPTIAGIAEAVTSDADPSAVTVDAGHASHQFADLQSACQSVFQSQGVDINDVEQVLPTTSMQEGLLLESDKYLNVIAFKLKPETSIKRLCAAWNAVSRKEPILRTSFASIDLASYDRAYFQFVLKEANSIEILHDTTLNDLMRSYHKSPEGQGLSSQKIQVSLVDEGHSAFLVLAMPHALYDAWSLYLLHQQVSKAYHSQHLNVEDPAPTTAADHLEHILSQSRTSSAHIFWEDQLSKIHGTILRQAGPSPDESATAFIHHKKSTTNLTEVHDFCKSHGVTLQSLGLACWTIALVHHSCQLDVCFGVVLSGRTTEGSDELVFPTFNTVIFRPRVRGNSTNAEAIKQIHDTVVQISEYQHFSLRDALKICRAQGSETDIFNTLFTFQKLPSAENDLPVLYDEITSDDTSAQPPYPVNVELESGVDRLAWTIAFQGGTVDEPFASNLLEVLDGILSTLISKPDQFLLQEQGGETSICSLPPIRLSRGQMLMKAKNSDSEVSPWTSTELIIRDVLADIAKMPKEHVKKTTGIFHLGLDSVSAIRVASALRKKGISLPVSGIIRANTTENMAVLAEKLKLHAQETRRLARAALENYQVPRAVKKSLMIPDDDIESIIPATAGQTFMLDFWTASGERLFYPSFWFKVTGTSHETFRNAFKKLAWMVPAFRTLFFHHDSKELPATWQVILKKEAAEKYCLPWTIHIEDHVGGLLVLLRIHHALYDAVSLQMCILELQNLCAKNAREPRLNTNFNRFISRTEAPRPLAQQFWTRYLGSLEDVFTPRSRGSFPANRVEKYNPRLFPIDTLTEKLKQQGLSIQALFFATYAVLYSRVLHGPNAHQSFGSSNPHDLVIGVYLANRALDIDGITELAAPTFNIVPLRIRVGGSTLKDTARQVQQDLAEITKIEHCGVSMRDIHAWTGIRIDTFVNFLSLPSEDEDEYSIQLASKDKLRIEHAELNTDQKERMQRSDRPSPFVERRKGADTAQWCLVS